MSTPEEDIPLTVDILVKMVVTMAMQGNVDGAKVVVEAAWLQLAYERGLDFTFEEIRKRLS